MTPLLDADLGVLQALAFVVDDLNHEIALPDRVDPGRGFGAPRIVGAASGITELRRRQHVEGDARTEADHLDAADLDGLRDTAHAEDEAGLGGGVGRAPGERQREGLPVGADRQPFVQRLVPARRRLLRVDGEVGLAGVAGAANRAGLEGDERDLAASNGATQAGAELDVPVLAGLVHVDAEGAREARSLDVDHARRGPRRRYAERRHRIAGDERKAGRLRVRDGRHTAHRRRREPRRQPHGIRLEYRHMRRRTFVQRALETGLVAPLSAAGVAAAGQPAPSRAAAPADAPATVLARDGVAERAAWVAHATRIADPVLTHLAAGTLKQSMPVEQAAGANRAPVTHLEALGRLLAGLAPWLALPAADTAEGRARARFSISRGVRSRRRSIRPRPTRSTSPPAASRWSTPRSWRTRSSARRPPSATASIRRRAPGSSPRSPRRG